MMDTGMVRIVDYLIVTSDYLGKYYDKTYGTDAIVIEDAIEVDKNFSKRTL